MGIGMCRLSGLLYDEIQNAAGTRRAKQVARRVFTYFLLFQKVRPAAAMPLTSSNPNTSSPSLQANQATKPLVTDDEWDLIHSLTRRVSVPYKTYTQRSMRKLIPLRTGNAKRNQHHRHQKELHSNVSKGTSRNQS